MNSVSFVSRNTGTVVGLGGEILRTTTGGSVVVSAEETLDLPREYVLYQNYPNPFNPSTTIVFDLPEAAFARLEVYDLLGRSVGMLARGVVDSGRHEVTWNAEGLPGGVYFCVLEVAGRRDVRKLVLAK